MVVRMDDGSEAELRPGDVEAAKTPIL